VGTSLQVTVDDTDQEREDGRLLSLAFPRGPSEKQRANLLDPVDKARAAGVPAPFIGHALISKKTRGAPWHRVDRAVEKAEQILQMLNLALDPKHLQDLQHLVDFAAAGNELPKTVPVDGERLVVAQILNQCTTWPAAAKVSQ
jgi:hypothetical protein